jgi:hypothetical protein
MRIANLKIHLISLGIICGVIILIYSMMDTAKTVDGTPQLQGDRYIQIDSATWGRNCDPAIDDAIKAWTLPKDPKEAAKAQKPHHAVTDNALLPISNACNGKMDCQFMADTDFIGDEPSEACYKELDLRYRCFHYDRLTVKKYNHGAQVTLDCSLPAADAKVSSPATAH